MILTTTNNIEGYKITEYKGILTADDNDGKFFSSGNPIDRALKNLEEVAKNNNCDAVIGISFIRRTSSSIFIVQVYGTGVKIEKTT